MSDADKAKSLLERLKKAAEKATPGPWKYENDTPGVRCFIESRRDPNWKDWIATCHIIPKSSVELEHHSNARFIAAANPKTLTALITALEECQRASCLVIQRAHEAHLQMPEQKIISMELSDFQAMRDLGKSISKLNEALALSNKLLAEVEG